MLFDDSYKTIAAASEGIFRDRGSKFVALAFPVISETEFKKHYNELKKLHFKANHHCYAYRLTTDRSVYKQSDDREPSGTAGKPILGVLLSNDLTDCAIVVARYFGGTLLGVPGLINAYKSAAVEAISNATIITKEITEHYQIYFPFDMQNDVIQLLKKFHAKIVESNFDSQCHIRFEISKNNADTILKFVKENHLFVGKVRIEI